MNKAMKLTTSILAVAVMTGGWGAATAAAQNPDAIDNAHSVAKSLQKKQANDSNAALNAAGVPDTAKPAVVLASAKSASSPTQAASPAKATTPQAAKSAAKPAPAKPGVTAKSATAANKAHAKTKLAAKPETAAKPADAAKPGAAKPEDKTAEGPKDDKKWAMSGKRDPFFSPVVQQNGPACSTGKKCLEINAINLRGVVKSDAGFIAVVTNNLGKAYFLRENDPVFNGFVVRITGDSVIFEETVEDKLGKPFTREVVKRIFTPAV
jgi:hypothetical protein